MSRALLLIACHEYGGAAVVYLAFLIRPWRWLPLMGRVLVGTGMLLHAAALAEPLVHQGWRTAGLAQALSALALLSLVIFLALDLRYRTPILGAFLTPLALVALVPGLILKDEVAPLSAAVHGPLLPVHVAIAVLGVAAFGCAFGVAVMYLLMERQMKGKRFGLLFSRLPSLDLLDRLNRQLVVAGFIALSITLVTGAFGSTAGGLFWQWEPKEVATLVGWLVFASLLGARSLAGWQGKRVAVLTMAGFAILLISFFSSFPPARAGLLQ